jgi:TusA-related sulfurtransferase
MTPDEHLDLLGVPCPANTARAMMNLEFMEPGELLELLLDDGEPIDNVPESLELEGHEIVVKERRGAHWLLLVKRGDQ